MLRLLKINKGIAQAIINYKQCLFSQENNLFCHHFINTCKIACIVILFIYGKYDDKTDFKIVLDYK